MTVSFEVALAKLAQIEIDLGVELYEALRRSARLIEREAKREIGHYQPERGPFVAWAPLKPRTVREKTALGYSPPDRPLLRTGQLRASIDYEVHDIVPGELMEAEVGANGVVAVAQSMGEPSRNLPARDFLAHAAVRMEVPIVEEFGEAAALAFGVKYEAGIRFL